MKEVSCGTIIINNNKVLIIKNNRNEYGFPKGHVENNELYKETALRETKEETNLDVRIIDGYCYKIQYKVNNNFKDVYYYLAYPLSFDIKKQESEVSDIIWVDKDKVIDYFKFSNLKDLYIDALKDINNL